MAATPPSTILRPRRPRGRRSPGSPPGSSASRGFVLLSPGAALAHLSSTPTSNERKKQMTTATATKPSALGAELQKLEAAKDKALAESRRAKIAAEDWDRSTAEQRLALSIRLQSHPDEFDGGLAKVGTEAAGLERAIKERMRGPNPHDAESAQATTVFHEAEAKLATFKIETISDRLAELRPDQDATVAAIRDAADKLAEACAQYASGVEKTRAIISTTPGLERGSEPSLGFDGRVSEWHALALDVRDTEIARPALSEVARWKLSQHV